MVCTPMALRWSETFRRKITRQTTLMKEKKPNTSTSLVEVLMRGRCRNLTRVCFIMVFIFCMCQMYLDISRSTFANDRVSYRCKMYAEIIIDYREKEIKTQPQS